MPILLLFAFLAGIVTVLSPCVLPVLPALLSAGAGRGALRPIGIISGLVFSFTFFTLALTTVVHLTGISPDFLRYIAIVLIAGFGLMMIFPKLGDTFAEATSGVADLGQSIQTKSKLFGSGFWSGFILGVALGLVWTPCAGPILAAITTLVATSSVTWSTFFITLAYSLGAAIPMFMIIYGGQKIVNSSRKISAYSEWIRKSFGVLMILAALAIALHYDVKLQQFAIEYIPFLNIEDNALVKKELDKLKSASTVNINKNFILPDESTLKEGGILPKIAMVPELVGITGWINTDPLTMQQLQGKVVLIDFWTYSCINCIRTFPYIKEWYAKYKDSGLVIVGVHTPEFEFEKNPDNIKEAATRFGLLYPIAIDSNFKTWLNFNNHYWPAHYLVDQMGVVRSFHFGEGAYVKTENEIRSLLNLPPLEEKEKVTFHRPITPETYLGFERADRYTPEIHIKPGMELHYTYKEKLNDNQVGLKGNWLISSEKIESKGDSSSIDLNFLATRVYLVMDSDKQQLVSVYLDGQPLDKKFYTADMNDQGQIMVKEPRKYDVINLKGKYGRHILTLQTPQGVSMYAFTFGDEP